jgi:hypothetical protein
MTTISMLLPVSMAGAMLLLPVPAAAQSGVPQLPVSLERIRAALEAPPPVFQVPVTPAEVPTFRVEVRQPYFSFELADEEPFDPTYGLPSVGELLMGGVGKIRSAAAGYKERRARRRARQEVADALAAFCAAHACPAADAGK